VELSFDQFQIRFMTLEDLPRILELEKEIYPSPWPEESFYYEIEARESYVLEVKESRAIVGYLCGIRVFDEYMVNNIALKPDYQGYGLATLLISKVLMRQYRLGCQNCFLEVRVTNDKAIKLYDRIGFKTINVRKNYYSNPVEDAFVMRCILKEFIDKMSSTRLDEHGATNDSKTKEFRVL